jgi:hypothetical protein
VILLSYATFEGDPSIAPVPRPQAWSHSQNQLAAGTQSVSVVAPYKACASTILSAWSRPPSGGVRGAWQCDSVGRTSEDGPERRRSQCSISQRSQVQRTRGFVWSRSRARILWCFAYCRWGIVALTALTIFGRPSRVRSLRSRRSRGVARSHARRKISLPLLLVPQSSRQGRESLRLILFVSSPRHRAVLRTLHRSVLRTRQSPHSMN